MKKLLLSLAALTLINSCSSNTNIANNVILDNQDISALSKTDNLNNQVSLLVDGEEIFNEIFSVIDNAKKKVYVSTYLFGESVGQKIAEKLLAKKNQGLEIQFVAEGTMGSIPELTQAAKKVYQYMIDNGLEVRIFPVDLMPKGPTFLSNKKMINHSKLVIADDSVAIVGGMNFKDSELVNHDYMLKISGPKVKEISQMTDMDWQKSRKMSIKSTDTTTLGAKSNDIEFSQTGFNQQNIDEMILKYINQAQNSIDIEMLLIDHQEVVKALADAKKRGVNIRIIVDQADLAKYNKLLEKLPIEGMANFGACLTLTDAGIPVKWFVPKTKDQVLHAKTILIDKKVFLTGSANLTYHALTRNHEVFLAVTDPKVIERFSQIFESDWASRGRDVELTRIQRALGKLFQKFGKWVYTKTEDQFLNDVPEARNLVRQRDY